MLETFENCRNFNNTVLNHNRIKEADWVADFVGARARGVGVHHLLYGGSVAAVEEGVLKTITACTYWLTQSVVSAHRRLLWECKVVEQARFLSVPSSTGA